MVPALLISGYTTRGSEKEGSRVHTSAGVVPWEQGQTKGGPMTSPCPHEDTK